MGGFGDVRQAKLRTALFWKDPIVALKTLRPTGNREQRIRILAVRTSVAGVQKHEANCSSRSYSH